MLKKILAICFIIVLMTSCSSTHRDTSSSSSSDDTGTDSDFSRISSQGERLTDFAVDFEAKKIFVALKDRIDIFDLKGNKTSSLSSSFTDCKSIAIYNNKIYVLDGNTLKILNVKGDIVKSAQVETDYVFQMRANGDYVFINTYDNQRKIMTLKVYNIQKAIMEEVDINSIYAFSLYDKNSILILTSENRDGKLVQYDFLKKSILKEYPCSLQTVPSYLDYDKNNDLLYWSGGSKIIKSIYKDNYTDTVKLFPDYMILLSKIYVEDNAGYVLDQSNGEIIKFSVSTDISKKKSLYITSPYTIELDQTVKKAYAAYIEKNKGANIIFNNIEDNNLKVKLMAKDTNMDIILVKGDTLVGLRETDAFIDLGKSEVIKNSFNSMFDGVEQNCRINGKLIGVPKIIDNFVWEVNKELLTKLGLDLPPENWTWNDFYEYAKKCWVDINGDGQKDTYLMSTYNSFPIFYESYNAEFMDFFKKKATFDNNEFRELLKIWKKLWDEDLIKVTDASSRRYDDLIIKDFRGLSSLNNGDKLLICPPVCSNRVYPSRIHLLSINSSSKNIDEAISFLEIYMSENVQTGRPLEGDIFYKDLSKYSTKLNNPNAKISNESNIQLFKNVLKYSRLYQYNPDIQTYMSEITQKYLFNNISLDEAIALLDKKVKMIAGE